MPNAPFHIVLAKRLQRREFLRNSMLAGASAWAMARVPGVAIPNALAADIADVAPGVFADFQPLIPAPGTDRSHQLAEGFKLSVLMRWGDKVLPGAPDFSAAEVNAARQEMQFGFNADFTAFLPLPRGSNSSSHGLLCVNHEYSDPAMMFPGYDPEKHTRAQTEAELAAHGASVVEIIRIEGKWYVVENSIYNRRISGLSTPIRIGGPAAGNKRMSTTKSPKGLTVRGMLGNCGGGVTPWGTVLTCEENFNQYFGGTPPQNREAENHKRYGIDGKPRHLWYKHLPRFNVTLQPREPNRFGWVVEYDPYNPKAMPVKRTALGRFKHETATCVMNGDGRLVVYSGDDEAFQCLYKFVSRDKVDMADPSANRNLLDHGILYAARFNEDGTLDWLPLVHGQGKLKAKHGFHSQADVLIEARRAAELAGATPMDRPEGIAVSPMDGRVYVSFSNNLQRTAIHAANPRAENRHGHIIELVPPTGAKGMRHGAESFGWDIFLLGQKPEDEGAADNALSCPDNLAFDPTGNLWIGTDGQMDAAGVTDSLYMAETSGFRRSIPRRFFNAPPGAEVAGPSFTPDGTTMFLSVQHPGEHSPREMPSTRWPDNNPVLPPRAAVIAVQRS